MNVRPLDALTRRLNELREQDRMTWMEDGQGWVGEPDEILNALAEDGFDECKRATTASRADCRPAGGVWQGINPRTGSVASAIWVARASGQPAMMFVEIDGQVIGRPGPDPATEAGGQA